MIFSEYDFDGALPTGEPLTITRINKRMVGVIGLKQHFRKRKGGEKVHFSQLASGSKADRLIGKI